MLTNKNRCDMVYPTAKMVGGTIMAIEFLSTFPLEDGDVNTLWGTEDIKDPYESTKLMEILDVSDDVTNFNVGDVIAVNTNRGVSTTRLAKRADGEVTPVWFISADAVYAVLGRTQP